MIITGDRRDNDIMSVPEEFASLLAADLKEQFVSYRIKYIVNLGKAFERKINIVRISAYEDSVSSEIPLFLSDRVKFEDKENFGRIGAIQDEPLACSILLHNSRCKDVLLFNSFSPLVSIPSDFTKKVDNGRFGNLSAGSTETIKTLTTINIEQAKKSNQSFPINEYSTKTGAPTKNSSISNSSNRLSLLKNIEPFSFIDKTSTRKSTKSSLAGTLAPKGGSSLTSEERSLTENVVGIGNAFENNASSQIEDNKTLVPVLSRREAREKVVSELLRVPLKGNFKNGNIFIRFDLIDFNGRIVQSIIKTINHIANINKFITPIQEPGLAVKSIDGQTNVVSVEQKDGSADCVKIYKKVIPEVVDENQETGYVLLRDINLKKKDGTNIFRDINNNGLATIYRAVSFRKKQSASKFGTAMPSFKGSFQSATRRIKSVVLNSNIISTGIFVEAVNIPEDVIEIRLVRKDLSLKEKNFSLIKNEHAKNVRENSSSFLDDRVKGGHIYEYKLKLVYSDGIEILSPASSIIEYNRLAENTLDLDVSTPDIVNIGSLNVEFNVNSKVEENTTDILKNKLKENGTFDIFEDEIKGDRENLSGILTHAIERHNLSTGEKEFLGTTTESKISDKSLSNKTGAKPLNKKHSYRYLVSTQLRETETLFENYKKKKTDENSGREYEFNPMKFLNPLTLKTGALVSKEALKLNHAKSEFQIGNLNNKKEVLVQGINDKPAIISATAYKGSRIRGKRNNIIKWKVSGERSQIDHFLISVKILQEIHFIGRTHNISTSNGFEFKDFIEPGDVGRFIYVITPIYNDYTSGKSFDTNGVIV